MKAIWIDPGETVGWVTAEVGHRQEDVLRLDVIDYGCTKLKTFALQLDRSLASNPSTYGVVGFESYHIRPDKFTAHAGSDVPTLQLIGMIRLIGWKAQRDAGFGFPQIISQPPTVQSKGFGAAKLWATPHILEVIRDADMGPHDEGHHASALKHLFAWYHENYRTVR